MAQSKHELSIWAEHKPKLATEGKEFEVTYFVKNVGKTHFPGGNLGVSLTWPIIPNAYVTDQIGISTPIPPESQISSKSKHTPLVAGYTFFTIYEATSTDGKPVEVYLPDRRKIFPFAQPGMSQLFHAARAQSHEELSQKRAVNIAVGSLVVVAFFQVLDWYFRAFLKF